MNEESKICNRCDHEKDIDLFPVKEGMRDGHLNTCTLCINLANKLYMRLKREGLVIPRVAKQKKVFAPSTVDPIHHELILMP